MPFQPRAVPATRARSIQSLDPRVSAMPYDLPVAFLALTAHVRPPPQQQFAKRPLQATSPSRRATMFGVHRVTRSRRPHKPLIKPTRLSPRGLATASFGRSRRLSSRAMAAWPTVTTQQCVVMAMQIALPHAPAAVLDRRDAGRRISNMGPRHGFERYGPIWRRLTASGANTRWHPHDSFEGPAYEERHLTMRALLRRCRR